MKLRMIPYGYKVDSGKVTPFDKEVIVIHRIFDEYIKGKGLKDIADELTTENIPIMEDMAVWSKNRIKRIITDKRYIGSDSYPSILNDEVFVRAQKMSEQKGFTITPCSPLIEFLKQHVICGQCGEHYRRLQINRSRGHWDCHGGCITENSVTDKKLLNQIEKIMFFVYQHREILLVEKGKELFERTPEVIRYSNEIRRMLDEPQPSFSAIKSIILECATAKFKCCNECRHPIYTDQMIKEFEGISKNDLLSFEFVSKVVDAILVNKSGEIVIRFVNDVEVSTLEVCYE